MAAIDYLIRAARQGGGREAVGQAAPQARAGGRAAHAAARVAAPPPRAVAGAARAGRVAGLHGALHALRAIRTLGAHIRAFHRFFTFGTESGDHCKYPKIIIKH